MENFMGLLRRIKQDPLFLKRLLIFFSLVFLVIAGADYYVTFQKNGTSAYLFKDDPLGVLKEISKVATTEAGKNGSMELRDKFIDSWEALELSKIRVVMYLVCSTVLVAFTVCLPKLNNGSLAINNDNVTLMEENHER
jgi:hypothetical protein